MFNNRPATAFISGFYKGHLAGAGRAPKAIIVGPGLYEDYESELTSIQRFSDGSDRLPVIKRLIFRNMYIYKKCEQYSVDVINEL